MIHHIVMWQLKEDIEETKQASIRANAKVQLEGLKGIIPGLLSVKVITDLLDSSTHDMALVTTLESKEALEAYQSHPAHVEVANTYIRPFVCNRSCLDYEDTE